MNSAQLKRQCKLKRQNTIANTLGWIVLAAGGHIGSILALKSLQVFFILMGA
jgi:hypothetical protein